jgi:phosphomannomutase
MMEERAERQVTLADVAATTGVGFGTSGARGLVSDMTDRVCYIYTTAFLQYLEQAVAVPQADRRVALAGDLRPSTERILRAITQAVEDRGYAPEYCGRIPSPAIALYGMEQKIPTIMVTGSHIPADRNGIKFNTADGEISKEDEAGILAQVVTVPNRFDGQGMLRSPRLLGEVQTAARQAFLHRWLGNFPADFLAGIRIGFYQHSAVGRDLLPAIYEGLGAEVLPFAAADEFIPVDTEAIRSEDVQLAADWIAQHPCDAILSTDGDSDRPLISDETGVWIRGDVAGILCARFCRADVVVAPISCNTAVERSGWFREVRRTRIGSPYVIAEMERAVSAGADVVVGYEANGGFLTATPVPVNGHELAPLPTRDPVIVHLALLGLSRREGKPLSQLLAELPARYTASARLKDLPAARSRERIEALLAAGPQVIGMLFPEMGPISAIDVTDGLRITFAGDDIIHLRPSGNAPELRCYTEADSPARARELIELAMPKLEAWRG